MELELLYVGSNNHIEIVYLSNAAKSLPMPYTVGIKLAWYKASLPII